MGVTFSNYRPLLKLYQSYSVILLKYMISIHSLFNKFSKTQQNIIVTVSSHRKLFLILLVFHETSTKSNNPARKMVKIFNSRNKLSAAITPGAVGLKEFWSWSNILIKESSEYGVTFNLGQLQSPGWYIGSLHGFYPVLLLPNTIR